MIKILRKIFIKDYQNINDEKIRAKHGLLASFFGIITNFMLSVIKIIIGLIVKSTSIITDAINNLSDMCSSIVNVACFKISNKPADKKHPFGHQRIEYITSLFISIFIVSIACILGYNSIIKIIKNGSTNFNIWAIIILSISIIFKLFQYFVYRYVAKLINSSSLKAASNDSICDIISTSAVLIASIIEFCFPNIHLDGYIGLCVSLFIVIMGFKMVKDSINPLLGEPPDKDFIQQIKKEILSYKGVLGIHDFICHNYGPTRYFITCHVEVDASSNVLKSHDLIDTIERDVEKKFKVLITIHMDPITKDNDEAKLLKAIVRETLLSIDEKISFHDFRIVPGHTHTNLVFDILIPFGDKIDEQSIKNKLSEKLSKLNKKYYLIINFDRDYTD